MLRATSIVYRTYVPIRDRIHFDIRIGNNAYNFQLKNKEVGMTKR